MGRKVYLSEERVAAARERMRRNGLTMADVAERLGVTRWDVHNVLTNRCRCVRGKLLVVALALGLVSEGDDAKGA